MKTFLLTGLVMAVLDFVWLKFIVSSFFFKQIGHLVQTKGEGFDISYFPAAFTYILMVTGLMVFVYPMSAGDPQKALLYGGLMGLVIYGVYEGTNMATLKNWPLKMLVVDTLWGVLLCGATAGLVTFLVGKI